MRLLVCAGGVLMVYIYIYGASRSYMVKKVEVGVEVKKVDRQGRLILPADWRESQIAEVKEVYIIKRQGSLKIIPKRRVDLTEYFDRVDLGVESIGDWSEFEERLHGDGEGTVSRC